MLGAIAGDIIGSVHEFHPWQGDWRDFPLFVKKSRFTDDTVMSMAVAHALMAEGEDDGESREHMVDAMHFFGRAYPHAGYGARFAGWLLKRLRKPYNSFGNGSAMRVSPVGWAFESLEEVERQAALSAEVTHNHPEGVKGACAVAGSIFLGRKGASREDIRAYVSGRYGYNLDRSLEEIRQDYRFNESCQGSVPEAITAFLESESFEEAVRKAVWLRGDADTQAAIAGSIAEAFYGGVPDGIAAEAVARLDDRLRASLGQWREWLAGARSSARDEPEK